MSHEFLDFVEDMLDAMSKAEALLEGVAYAQFEADYRINFAVVRALEIIVTVRRVRDRAANRHLVCSSLPISALSNGDPLPVCATARGAAPTVDKRS